MEQRAERRELAGRVRGKPSFTRLRKSGPLSRSPSSRALPMAACVVRAICRGRFSRLFWLVRRFRLAANDLKAMSKSSTIVAVGAGDCGGYSEADSHFKR